MRKIIYTVALVVMGITASYAQKPGRAGRENQTPEQRAEKAATAMQQKLSLTADQKQKVQQIELDRFKKNDEWRKNDEGAMKGKMEERKAFAKASKEKLDAVLTADQKKTLAASRDEMKGKMKDRRAGKGPRGPRGAKPNDGTPPPPPTKN
jgi:protein CpxP